MATIKDFYLGARPKTLSAAVSPVLIGLSLAGAQLLSQDIKCSATVICSNFAKLKQNLSFWDFIGCIIVGVALQVGVNYANDYSDGKKGTDKDRVGPMRLVGSGTASPKSVFIAMCVSFMVASLAGLYLASRSSWWLILVGVVCVSLAYLYTGTKLAYGYYGFGELVVFITFGLTATVGTFYIFTGKITLLSIVGSFIPGMFSVAILLANNIRDIETDREANKKTLPSRIGHKHSFLIFGIANLLVYVAIIIIGFRYHYVFIALIVIPFLGYINKSIVNAKTPKDYVDVLVNTSKINIVTSIAVSILIILSVL